MFNQHDTYRKKQNATFEQRIIAFVIDTILCTTIGNFLNVFTSFAIPGITLFYFTLSQSVFGYTLGKYLLGLRIISTTGQSSLIRMLLRESILKWISGVFLGLGYLFVIFRKNRTAWHDSLSSTRVITLKQQHTSGLAQMARGLASLIIVSFITIGIFSYQLFYTPFAIEKIAKSYASFGLEITGITGNYFNGYHIKKLAFQNEEHKLFFEDIFLQLNKDLSLLERITMQKVILNQFIVKSGNIEILNLESFKLKDLIQSLNRNAKPDKINPLIVNNKTFKIKKSRNPIPLRIDLLEISNTKIKKGDSEFYINRFSIADFETNPGLNASFKHIFLDSSLGRIYTKDYHYNVESGANRFNFSGHIAKDNSIINGLRRNITFSGSQAKNETFSEFKLSLFNQSLNILKESSDTEIITNNLSLIHYIDDHFPISKMSLTMNKSGIEGHYYLRNRKISIPKQNFINIMLSGLKGYSSNGFSTKVSPLDLISNKPWFNIEKTNTLRAGLSKDHLSYLYLGKNYRSLSKKSKMVILKDYKFLSNVPFQKFMEQFGGKTLGQLVQSGLKPPSRLPSSENKGGPQQSIDLDFNSQSQNYKIQPEEN